MTRARPVEPWDRPVTPTPASSFERSARFWLNAYPWRWRAVHGEEALGVLEDLARDGDGVLPTRLARAEAWGLLRAGWALRWRQHPPLWPWIGYRFLGRRLPERYWWWIVDDIRGVVYPLVEALGRAVLVMGIQLGVFSLLTWGSPLSGSAPYANWLFWAVVVPAVVAVGAASRHSRRRRAWVKHVAEGNVPAWVLAWWDSAGTMTPGADPAITGEPPEERPRT